MAIRLLIGGSFECEDCGDVRPVADMLIEDGDSLCADCWLDRGAVAAATAEQEQNNEGLR